MQDQLTFVIFTFNEEQRLPWIIKNFGHFARILVVDNESTDNTVEIAKAAGCDVLINKNQGWVDDEVTTSLIKNIVKTEWIYWGFADEMLKSNTLQQVFKAISGGAYDVIRLKRKNYFYGAFCYDAESGYQTKFFKKNAIDFSGNVIHGFGKIIVPEQRVYAMDGKYFVGHFMDDDMSSYMVKINRYTDTEAEQLAGIGTMTFLNWFLLKPFKKILVDYFIRGGFKAGLPGFILIFTQVLYIWVKAIKLYEKKHGIKRRTMEDLYQISKEEYLH